MFPTCMHSSRSQKVEGTINVPSVSDWDVPSPSRSAHLRQWWDKRQLERLHSHQLCSWSQTPMLKVQPKRVHLHSSTKAPIVGQETIREAAFGLQAAQLCTPPSLWYLPLVQTYFQRWQIHVCKCDKNIFANMTNTCLQSWQRHICRYGFVRNRSIQKSWAL